ncbi:MAG: class I SAM-dependent methyltransferase [Parvibaculaceae bacterium]|nr:class I SAM-dependent methyltransferase [Parvibaculaceae bacterium]
MSTHASLMDDVYRRQRHIYDATRKFYLLGRDRLIRELAPPPGGTVLEIACGTGRNLIAAAQHYPRARFSGFDLSTEMLATALHSTLHSGIGTDRIVLAQGDATSFSPAVLFGVETFDRVFISYALSMIPDWPAAIEQGLRALSPGGELHIVDFGQQEGLPAFFRRGLFAWLARFHVSPRADLFEVAQEAAARHGGQVRQTRLYRDYARSVTVTLDQAARRSSPISESNS